MALAKQSGLRVKRDRPIAAMPALSMVKADISRWPAVS
jgi:hypothetical protein